MRQSLSSVMAPHPLPRLSKSTRKESLRVGFSNKAQRSSSVAVNSHSATLGNKVQA